MGQMLIRNLDDGVIADLKRRAARHRTSAEEEARRALTASVRSSRDAIIAKMNAIAEANGPQPGPTSLEILRSFRYPDGDD
jgi:plasmid stability protein